LEYEFLSAPSGNSLLLATLRPFVLAPLAGVCVHFFPIAFTISAFVLSALTLAFFMPGGRHCGCFGGGSRRLLGIKTRLVILVVFLVICPALCHIVAGGIDFVFVPVTVGANARNIFAVAPV